MIWFDWILNYINLCRLLSAKSCLYIYIKYIKFSWVGFYSISTIVGYFIPYPLYAYIYQIYMIWLGWVLWHINHCRLLMPNSLYTYILNI